MKDNKKKTHTHTYIFIYLFIYLFKFIYYKIYEHWRKIRNIINFFWGSKNCCPEFLVASIFKEIPNYSTAALQSLPLVFGAMGFGKKKIFKLVWWYHQFLSYGHLPRMSCQWRLLARDAMFVRAYSYSDVLRVTIVSLPSTSLIDALLLKSSLP